MERTAVDYIWVIVGSALVFMMQAGFAMVESGLTRSKNSINVAIKNLTDFGISTLCFWILGFGLMFGASMNGIFGTNFFLFNPASVWPAVFLLFQAVFCSTSATIVSGAVAERMRFSSYIISTIILSSLIYPVFGHWAWGGFLEGAATGWLGGRGFTDFAGSTVVHSVGGWVALAALFIIGPRTGRFGYKGEVQIINGSSIPMAVLGVFLLWFGWIGFNGASTLAANDAVPGIIMRTMLGGSAGMVFALAVGWPLSGKPEVSLMLNGALAGLVAVTANCHVVSETQAVIIGGAGGVVMLGASWLLVKLRIDDAVDAIPVHLAAGIWGTLAVGIFGDLELLGTGLSRWEQIGVQLLGVASCGALCLGLSFPLLWLLNRFIPLRIGLHQEAEGLNKSEHGVTTEINDLFTVLDNQAKTGDIGLRAPVEPFTEAGQIARMYNSVLDKLQDSTVEKGEYLNILENVSDGLFLLDSSGKIGPYYSASLEKIFRRSDLAGREIMEVFRGFLNEKTRTTVQEFFDVAFDSKIAWRHVEKLNPLAEVDAYFDDHAGGFITRCFEFVFTRVARDGNVERLFVVVRDVTERKELAEEIKKTRNENRQEMEMLQRVLHVDPETLVAFLESVKEDSEAINEELRSGSENYSRRLDTIFRHSHAVKGDAELLMLDFLADKAEALEQKILVLRRAGENLTAEDFLPLTISCSELMGSIEKLDAIITKWLKLSDTVRGSITRKGYGITETLRKMAQRLAERYGKEVELEMPGFDAQDFNPDKRKAIKDILLQLVRNSVYHGIEAPAKRRGAGKPEKGFISIRTETGGSGLRIIYRDDGAGINAEKVKKRALAAGIISEEKAASLSEREKILFIFHPGFSTAEKPDSVAGKGVGLSLVKEKVKELGGKLSLKSRVGSYCEFSLVFPLPEPADEGLVPEESA
ncbi:MAG: ammonium transporter [Spirochaetales bacterium]|jgi:Amt family ammonium transporter|nr:ammonium transporter [Spirochaetales bacterium]